MGKGTMTPAAFLAKIGFDLKGYERSLLERKQQNHAHTAPSDEPLSWDTKGKVVTLDHAIMATHMMADNLIFGSFRSIIDQALRIVASKVLAKLEDVGLSYIAKETRISKSTLNLALQLGQVFDENRNQEVKEIKLRKVALDTQRGLWKAALIQRGERKRTRRVLSRHKTPRQRKPHKGIHFPKKVHHHAT